MLRIRRRVLRRDLRLELGRIEREVARLAQVDRDRHRAVGDDLRLVDRKAGHGIDHLVAGAVVGDRRDRVRDERLRARADDDIVGLHVDAAARADVLGRGRAQLVDAGRRRVAVLARPDRGDRRVLHVARRRESPAGRCRTRRCPCPLRTSALTSASTTNAFSVPSDSARRDSGGIVTCALCGAFIEALPCAFAR